MSLYQINVQPYDSRIDYTSKMANYNMITLLYSSESLKVSRLKQTKLDHSLGRKINYVASYPIDYTNDYEISKAINYDLAVALLNLDHFQKKMEARIY